MEYKEQIKNKLNNLPKNPGVYFYYDRNGKLIYVGKASVLKHRVNSYFRGAPFDKTQGKHDLKTEKLVSEIRDLKWQETKSVIEALILESNLIKKHQPKYNIQEKDDKSFVQIALTNEEFPRFVVFRPTEKEKVGAKINKYFGPYTSTSAVNEILNILRKIFTYRDCSKYKFSRFAKKMSPCLYYPLNLCPAPCARYISKEEYNEIIKQITDFLSGKRKRVISELKKQMDKYSKAKEYEKAAQIRDRIYAFEHINDVALIKQERSLEQYSNIPGRIEVYDISNLGSQFAVGSMVVFERGEVNKDEYRKFRLRDANIQIYANDANKKNGYVQHIKSNENIKNYISSGHSERSEESQPNRSFAITQDNNCDSSRLRSNNKKNGHPEFISGSQKILKRVQNDKNCLKSPIGDPQMMAQVIDRRFNNDWPNPNLIILDGGKGQLSAVLKTLKDKKMKIPVIAVAKGPTRKGFRLFKNSLAQNIVLDRKFIERMRDEAHRFAINYHRKLKNKIRY